MLSQNIVLFFLPEQLVLGPMRLQVFDQVTSGESEHLEELLELLGGNVKVLLEAFEEVVMSRLVLLLTS